MGWTSYYTGSMTSAEKKAELDKELSWERKDDKGNLISSVKVLKSSMVGSVYYGAYECKNNDGMNKVIAVVCLTQMDHGEFYYKDMTESMGPCECKCPVSVFKLLTPTDEKFALEWRERVKAYHQNKPKSHKYELGDIITAKAPYTLKWGRQLEIQKGETVHFVYTNYYSQKKLFLYCDLINGVAIPRPFRVTKALIDKLEDKQIIKGVSNE